MTVLYAGPAVPVVGAAAVSALGFEWCGLAAALEAGEPALTRARDVATSPVILGAEVPELSVPRGSAELKAARLVSRPARFAAHALGRALECAGWADGYEEVGLYLGVGAASGPPEQMRAMLRASLVDGRFCARRFSTDGLAAVNPLFAFHLLNNLTLCHGAIAEGLSGPNAAFFSRGAGTVMALAEGSRALQEGECERVLTGGADSALYAGTWLELVRDGRAAGGLVPGEGAAILALSRRADHPLAWVTGCAVEGERGTALEDRLTSILADLSGADDAEEPIVLAAWGDPPRTAIGSRLRGRRHLLDLTAVVGEALAASPALGWAAGLDLLCTGRARRVIVVSAGPDDCLAAVGLARGDGA